MTTQGGDPVELSGWSAHAQVRVRAADERVLFEWTPGEVTAPALQSAIELVPGMVILRCSAAQSSTFQWYRGVYDLELTSPEGSVSRPVSGSVRISPEVTRPRLAAL